MTVNESILLILLRTVFSAFLLIAVPLIIPELRLGGRYLMLLEAIIIAFSAQTLRNFLGARLRYRERSILTGLCVIVILGLIKLIFAGVNLSITGILFLYCGAVFLEILLPNRLTGGIWRND